MWRKSELLREFFTQMTHREAVGLSVATALAVTSFNSDGKMLDDIADLTKAPISVQDRCENDEGVATVFTSLRGSGVMIVRKDDGKTIFENIGAGTDKDRRDTAKAYCDDGTPPVIAAVHQGRLNYNFDCEASNGAVARIFWNVGNPNYSFSRGNHIKPVSPYGVDRAKTDALIFCMMPDLSTFK